MRHGKLVLVAVLSLLASGAVARAEKKAFTIADHYRVVGVSDPQVSPDGRRIVYVAGHTDLAAAKQWSELRIMAADGSGDRPLTQGKHKDSSPRWSPDGAGIAFVSDRSGDETQLFLLPLDGGDAAPADDVPDGRGRPGVVARRALHRGRLRGLPGVRRRRDVQREDREGVERRPAEGAHGGRAAVPALDVVAGRHVQPRPAPHASRTARSPTLRRARSTPRRSASAAESGYAFAPDSRELVVVSNHDAVPARSTNADLWAVPIDEAGKPGPAADLTAANPAWDGSPAYSPDGRFIAYRTQAHPRLRVRPVPARGVRPRPTKTHRVLTEAFRNWIDDFRWLARLEAHGLPGRGRGAHAAVSNSTSPPARFARSSATPRSTPGSSFRGGVAYARRSVGEPAEIYRSALDGGHRVQFTHAQRRPRSPRWTCGPPRRSGWTAPAGHRVQVFIVKPHGFDPAKKYPLILNVHGGPQSAVGRRVPRRLAGLPGRGLRRGVPQPDRLDRLRPGVHRRDLGRLGRQGLRRPDGGDRRAGEAAVRGRRPHRRDGLVVRRHDDDVARGPHRPLQGDRRDDGRLRPARRCTGATEELWFPEHDLGGEPWTSAGVPRSGRRRSPCTTFKTPCLVVTGERDYRVPVHAVLRVLHRPAGDEGAVAPGRAFRTPGTGRRGTRWRSTTTSTSTGSTATWAANRRRGTRRSSCATRCSRNRSNGFRAGHGAAVPGRARAPAGAG